MSKMGKFRHLYGKMSVAALILGGASGQAIAQAQTPATAQDSGIEEIVVTAQKRSENLQDVPISIQAFNNSSLERAGVRQIENLPNIVPGITIGRSAGGSSIFIRGVGATDSASGQESPVSTYVDGVYMQSVWSNNAALKNVERVEVLKGPQGTLFGRNATGGLIHVVTRDPSSTSGGEMSFTAGNYQTYEVSTYATTGIAEGLAADVTGYVRRQERGYGKNLITGNDANFNNEATVRTKWQYKSGDTNITASADYSDIDDTRGLNRNIVPGATGVGRSTYSGSYYDVKHNVDFSRKTRAYGGSLTVDQDLGSASLTSISAARWDRSHFIFDNDIGPAPITVGDIIYTTKTLSQELRIASAPSDGISWIGGLFYFRSNAGADLSVLAGPSKILAAHFVSQLVTNSYSAFGEVGIPMFGQGKLTLGGRYTSDRRTVSGLIGLNRLPGLKASWKQPTWRIVYDHHVNDDVMFYAGYNRGFKSGNFNILPANQPAYAPEKIDAYEIGIKTNLLDDRVRFNMSAFYYDYRDLQVRIISALTTKTINAASARIKGVEGELTAKVLPGLTLSAAGAYVHADYSSFKAAPDYRPAVIGQFCPGVTSGAPSSGGNCLYGIDASGRQLIRSPRFSGNVGATLVVPSSAGDFTADARLSYRDSFPWEPAGRIRAPAATLVNASLTWNSKDSGLSVSVRGDNIFGEKYQIYGGSVDAGDFYSAGAPGIYSVTVGFKF
ncbi:TonB-dependent receptor [Rhizorhabdus argentea]|uniref:TonB-dependent receptor n=1 Tax=Rhizorhabdus argentea TaxID=1387174 RepID=UPI0030EBAD21